MRTPKPPADGQINSLFRRSISLGGANALDYALQFLLPVIFVRYLTAEAFGQYRLLWLAVMTVMVVLPLAMPQSLYFFLPRGDLASRRRHVRSTVVYLALAGMLGSLILMPWNPLLPEGLRQLGGFLPAIMLLFAVGSLLDILPTIEEQVGWQISLTVMLAVLRLTLLGAAALITGQLDPVLWLLAGLLGIKLGLLFFYLGRHQGLSGRWFDRPTFLRQFRHAAPLGLSSALYGLRGQADQWVAAGWFALNSFAAFSIAAVLGPLINLFRQTVNHVFLPSMSRLHAAGELAGMVELNSRANAMVGHLVYPLLALAFAYAEEIISLVYTRSYLEAVPVMRVYIVGLFAFVIELSSLILLLREGRFSFGLNASLLVLSVGASALGAYSAGLAGAAFGSTLAIFLDRWLTLRRLSRAIGIGLARLQDWSELGLALLWSIAAALLARLLTDQWPGDGAAFYRIVLGATAMLIVYGSFWWFHRRFSTALVSP